MNLQRIINLLTICKKAGKLVSGFGAAMDSVKNGTSKYLLIASNTSKKTVKEVYYQLEKKNLKNSVRILTVPLTKEEFAWYINSGAGVIAICDEEFSKSFEKLLT